MHMYVHGACDIVFIGEDNGVLNYLSMCCIYMHMELAQIRASAMLIVSCDIVLNF